MAYDVIVVGLGGVGSAAVYQLAQRGLSVLGLDQFSPPHDHGSSHGETRVIRKAYFEHPGYVPMLRQAYHLWQQLESEVGRQLYYPTGLVEIGPRDGIVIPGVLRSAAAFNLPIETLTMREAMNRYPTIRGDESWSVVVERDAGYLLVEACVAAHLQRAATLGADLRTNQAVVDWQIDGTSVIVNTKQQTFRAAKLVLAAGPWAAQMLLRIGVPLSLLRKHIYWFGVKDETYGADAGFPCYLFETPTGYFYGTPQRDELGLKVACHSGGTACDTLLDVHHRLDRSDQTAVENFLAAHLPSATNRLVRCSGCYYTMTPDGHFVVDLWPELPNITVIAGLSGHGFKFCSVLGKIAADLATGADVGFDLTFLQIDRFLRPVETPPLVG